MAIAIEGVHLASGDTPSVTLAGSGTNRLIVALLASNNTTVLNHSTFVLNSVAADSLFLNYNFDSGRAVNTSIAYWLDANNPGAGTFSFGYAGEGLNPNWIIYEFSGVDQTTPLGTPATNSAGAQSDGSTLTATLSGESGEFVLSYCGTADASASTTQSAPSANLDGTTYGQSLGQSGFAADTDSACASASEAYTWTLSHDGATVIDSSVVVAVAVYAAGAGGDTNISGTVDALTLTEYPATLALDVGISGTVDALTLTEYPATLTFDVGIAGTVDVLTLTAFPASIAADTSLTANLDALTLTPFAATIAYGVNVAGTTVSLTLTEYPAIIGFDVNVLANVATLTLTPYAIETASFFIDGATSKTIASDLGGLVLYGTSSDWYSLVDETESEEKQIAARIALRI